MNDAVRILMVAGSSGDTEAIENTIRTSGIRFTSRRVTHAPALRDELETFSPDLVLADYQPVHDKNLPHLSEVRHLAPHVPVILLAESRHHAAAAECLGDGVADYVLKDRLGRLVPSIHRAAAESGRRKAALRAVELERQVRRFRHLLDIPDLLAQEDDVDGILRLAAMTARDLTGAAGAAAFFGPAAEGFSHAAHFPSGGDRGVFDTFPTIVAGLRDDLNAPRPVLPHVHFFFSRSGGGDHAIAAVPLSCPSSRLDGMIAVWKSAGSFLPDEETVLPQLASLVALALAAVRAREELVHREQEVAAVRGNLDALLEHVPLPAALADGDGTIVAASRLAREKWLHALPARSEEQFLLPGFRFSGGGCCEDMPHLRAMAAKETVREKLFVATPSGPPRNVSCVAAPACDRAGAVTGAVLLWEEVEPREGLYPEGRSIHGGECDRHNPSGDVADKLDMRGLFRMVLDILPLAVWVVDKDAKVLIANSPAATMCGGSVRHSSCHGIWSEKGKKVPRSGWPVTRALALGESTSGRVFELECCGTKKVVQMSAVPIRNERGAIVAATVVCDDITERKLTEKALRESEKKFRAIFEEAKSVICTMSLDLTLEDINPAAQELFGWSREGINAVDPHDFFVCDNDLDELVRRLVSDGSVKDLETTMRRRDGRSLAVLISASVIRDDAGAPTAYRLIVHDMTERKELEQQLLQAQKMESVGLLAGGIAHDFNNLLTAICGYGEMLQEQLPPHDSHLHMCITQVLTASERAAALTGKLLAFGRKQILNPRPVLINDVISSTSRFLKRIIGEDIDFVTCLTGKKLTVLADTVQIEQVLMNLAANARDAMPKGGRLQVTTSTVTVERGKEKLYGLEEPGRYAVVSVSDTGVGMDEETCKRIFEPFFTTKEVGKGTGLGLSIIYGILSQHRGSVTVTSRPGAGTTFNLYLPLAKSRVKEGRPVDLTVPEGGVETILVAEDEEIVRTYLSGILENVGYRVVTAENGEEALRKFRKHQKDISLVVTDVVMPRKNGQDLSDELQRLKPGIRVIFTSGYTHDILRTDGRDADDLPFLCKPIVKNDLLRKVREELDRDAGGFGEDTLGVSRD